MDRVEYDRQLAHINAQYEKDRHTKQQLIDQYSEEIRALNERLLEWKSLIRQVRNEMDEIKVNYLQQKATILNEYNSN
jgi:phage shock protein A